MTDKEIKKERTFEEELSYYKKRLKEVFDNYKNPNGNEDPLEICVLHQSNRVLKKAEETINRQQAEIEKLTYKLECLLCHATGSKLSKSTYSLRTMEIAVNDEVQQCCEEAKAEAIKEFAEEAKAITYHYYDSDIDELLKERLGDTK